MNITIITPNGFPEIGGDILIINMISSGLAKKGHNVKWICRHYENTKNEEFLGKVKIERVKIPNIWYGRSFWFSLYGMRHILEASKDSDVIQFDTFFGSYIDWITKKINKKPSVLLVYGLLVEFWKEFSKSKFERHILPKIEAGISRLPFDRFTTPCNFTRNMLIKYGADEDRVKRIYLGINHEVFHKTNNRTSRNPSNMKGKFVIGYLGRMKSAEKNVNCLIEAFKIVKENVKNSVLLLAGSGFDSQKKNIKREGLKINKDIFNIGTFPQNQNKKQARWYSSLDVFASPSLIEGFGLPFVEAQACGTPVVCFNRTAMPEVVKHNVTGLLVNETTPKALANALIDFHNKNLKRKFSSKCMRWSEQFTWKKCIEEYLKVYRELI